MQHAELGPLFDWLQMQFFAAKHAEALAILLDAAYVVDLAPRTAPAHGATTKASDGK